MSGGEGALDKYWAALKETYRRRYSEVAADHMVFPRNAGEMIEHNAFGIINDDHDDTLAIWLKVENGRITNAAFSSQECMTCTACGSMVTELARGKTIDEAKMITPEEILESLEGLPEEDQHCAKLAVDTLQEAVKDYPA
jgi:nitrogen fixation protein NifU and related proteins